MAFADIDGDLDLDLVTTGERPPCVVGPCSDSTATRLFTNGGGQLGTQPSWSGAPEQADGYEESAPQEPLPAEAAVEEPEASAEAPATNESVKGNAPTEKTLHFDPGTT